MLDHEILKSVAEQMMKAAVDSHFSQKRREVGHPQPGDHPGEIVVEGKSWPLTRSGVSRLRMVRFAMGGSEYQAIEQNPEKPSRWGQLARDRHKVVQFRDVKSGKYVAVVVDGKVTEYGRG